MSADGSVRLALEAQARELAMRAIYEPTAMTEAGWRKLNALLSLFHGQWYAEHHPRPPCPITFGQAPAVSY